MLHVRTDMAREAVLRLAGRKWLHWHEKSLVLLWMYMLHTLRSSLTSIHGYVVSRHVTISLRGNGDNYQHSQMTSTSPMQLYSALSAVEQASSLSILNDRSGLVHDVSVFSFLDLTRGEELHINIVYGVSKYRSIGVSEEKVPPRCGCGRGRCAWFHPHPLFEPSQQCRRGQ